MFRRMREHWCLQDITCLKRHALAPELQLKMGSELCLTACECRAGMIYDQSKIAQSYLRGSFTLDLISSIPFDMLSLAIGEPASALRFVRIIRLVRLTKLLRMFRVSKFLAAVESSVSVNYSHLDLVQHILFIMMAAHWMACLCLLFSRMESSVDADVYWGDMAAAGVSDQRAYVTALYWSSMTLTTIGCELNNALFLIIRLHFELASRLICLESQYCRKVLSALAASLMSPALAPQVRRHCP